MKMRKNKKNNDCKNQSVHVHYMYMYNYVVNNYVFYSEIEKTSADMYDPRQQVSE